MKFPADCDWICIDHWDEALYSQALSWVDDTKRVSIISEEERISSDPRVKIYHLESPLQLEGIIRHMGWWAVQKKIVAIGSEAFQQKLNHYHLAAHLILSEAADWGTQIFQNAKANLQPYRRGLE